MSLLENNKKMLNLIDDQNIIKNNIYEENIDQLYNILKEVTLNKPLDALEYFIKELYSKSEKKINFILFKFKNNNKYNLINEIEKEKYSKMVEEAKLKYNKDIIMVEHYLFNDYNGYILEYPTAFRIYLNEKLIKSIYKNNKELKDIKLKK